MLRINKGAVLLFLSAMLLFGCAAVKSGGMMESKPLNLNDTEQEFLSAEFNIVRSRDQIGDEVIKKLSGKNALIANPGEKYNETDFLDLQYPSRMILFAGKSRNMTFVHYMQGGFAPHPVLYLAKFKDEQIFFECSYIIPKANDIGELKSLFQSKAERIKDSCSK